MNEYIAAIASIERIEWVYMGLFALVVLLLVVGVDYLIQKHDDNLSKKEK